MSFQAGSKMEQAQRDLDACEDYVDQIALAKENPRVAYLMMQDACVISSMYKLLYSWMVKNATR